MQSSVRPALNVRKALPPVLVCLALAALAGPARAQGLDYQTPPAVLAELVDVPASPEFELAPSESHVLVLERRRLATLAELSARELRLGGLRFNPATNAPSRRRPVVKARLLELASGKETALSGLPAGARLDDFRFSPDGSHLAFTLETPARVELWVAEVATGRARRLSERALSLAARTRPQWLPDGSGLLVALVPAERGAEPAAPAAPRGPVVQTTERTKAPNRTFQDLLANPHDEALFEHFLTTEIARVTLAGRVAPLGKPGIFLRFEPSPSGNLILVEEVVRPFSYLVPFWRFPRRVEVWDALGNTLRRLADLPLQEAVPITFDSVPAGPRQFAWRDDAAETVTWVEALDGGDAAVEAAQRDALYQLPSPFRDPPQSLLRTGSRLVNVSWGEGGLALATASWWKTRREETWLLRADSQVEAPRLLFERSSEDRYSDPGLPLTRVNAAGRPLLMLGEGGKSLTLVGDGASAEGDRPFLDAFDLTSKATKRLFRSQAPHYELPLALLASGELLLSREGEDQPADLFVRNLGNGAERRLTSFPHPTPQLAGATKELIRYRRADGVELSATLLTPPGWKRGDAPLPVVVWAYPQEFKSADAAGQVRDSPYRFNRMGWPSPFVWLARGYAVLDDPSLPIVGEGEAEPNDSYVRQLVDGAAAAVEELVRRGVADRKRIAIGGHSYGAFTTANLLIHSDLFAAGIAESGAYNRTLTPFGFQAEERTLWQAPEVYAAMSPFMHAQKLNEPLLLIHGAADENPGTFPMQSERLFNAVKGLGGTARLVMLPEEGHGYRARESALHVLWETDQWLARYLGTASAEGQGAQSLTRE